MDLSIGILIVGSLLWDRKEHREDWRSSRLDLECRRTVWAPIRYGRKSGSWGGAYTMMIAPELEEQQQMGTGVVVPCVHRATSPANVIEEARALWAAEQKDRRDPGPLSAKWGSVGLLANPASEVPDVILRDWAACVAGEQHYAKLLVPASAPPPVSSCGMLSISWPKCVLEDAELNLDLLLATATGLSEERETYPSAKEIAAPWNDGDKENRLYFRKNRESHITTFEDDAIASLLITSK